MRTPVESLDEALSSHVYVQCSDVSRGCPPNDIFPLTFWPRIQHSGASCLVDCRVILSCIVVVIVLKMKHLSLEDRKCVFAMLFMACKGGKVEHGGFVRVAAAFGVGPLTIKRAWSAILSNMEAHLEALDDLDTMARIQQGKMIPMSMFPDHVYSSSRKRGGHNKLDRKALAVLTANLPLNQRGTHRNHAACLRISPSTSWRLSTQGDFCWHTSSLKPSLSAENKAQRLLYCLSFVEKRPYSTRAEREWYFQDMYDTVHVDEKWFYLTKDHRRYLLAPGENAPVRSVQHKSHIEKVMFLRLRHDYGTNAMRDGKIGMWPVGDEVKAKRNGKHLKKGDAKWKNKNIDSDVYLELMEEVVISIAMNWPRGQWSDPSFRVRIQQDGAKVHTSARFQERWECLLMDMVERGLLPDIHKVYLDTQPSNSPDLNINDLGLFAALQAQYEKSCPRNALELIEQVLRAHAEYPAKKINHLFLTLQACMNEIIVSQGNNDYVIPHLSKAKLEREGRLPVVLPAMDAVVELMREMEEVEEESMAELHRGFHAYCNGQNL